MALDIKRAFLHGIIECEVSEEAATRRTKKIWYVGWLQGT